MNDVDIFLEHYGRKGMQWGVVNDDDAPSSNSTKASQLKKDSVTPEQAAKREAKAVKYDTAATKLRTEQASLQKRLDKSPSAFEKHQLKNEIKEIDKLAKTAEKDAIAAREGRMSSRKKKLLVGAAVAGGLVATYGSYKMTQSGQFTSMATKGKAHLNGNPMDLFKKNSKLANPDYSADDIMKNVIPGVNPGYGKWGTNMNCRRATFAYEMRRRGYDVQATRTSNASGQTALGVVDAMTTKKLDKGTKMRSALEDYAYGLGKVGFETEDRTSIFKRLEQEPDRSRGEFAVAWKSGMPGIPGGAHSMAYEIIKGKAHIFDAQTGEEYKNSQNTDMFYNIQSAAFTRLDNATLNENFLSKWVR